MRPQGPRHGEGRGLWPSVAEEVQAIFLDWLIERDITEDGCHGDWIARHRDNEERILRAPDIEALRELLKQADELP